jgi:hypothetical protein
LDAIDLIGFGFQFNATNTPNDEWVNTYNDVIDNIVDFRFLFFPALDTTLLVYSQSDRKSIITSQS